MLMAFIKHNDAFYNKISQDTRQQFLIDGTENKSKKLFLNTQKLADVSKQPKLFDIDDDRSQVIKIQDQQEESHSVPRS